MEQQSAKMDALLGMALQLQQSLKAQEEQRTEIAALT
jgi:hypothetical protein